MNDSIEKKPGFLQKLKNNVKATLISLKEQKIIFATTIFAFVFVSIYICNIGQKHSRDLFMDLGLAAMMACLFCIPAAFLTKGLKNFYKYCIQVASALVGGILGYFSKQGFGNSFYGDLYFFGIAFAGILITVYIFIPKENCCTYFAGLIKHCLFTFLMATLLFGGLSLLIFAFQSLIFEFDDWADVYQICAAFCYIVFFVNVFVYYLFYRRQEENSGKAFKIIFLYILLPVFFTLIAVLYIYLIKALVLRKLPNGQINWFVSFACCFYILFYFTLKEFENLGAVRVFYKFGAFAFIPLICVQIPAYFIRLNAYGFTGWRFSSLLFIIFSILTIALTFIKKGEFTKYAILLLAAIILFASVSPFNLINSAYKSQFKRMMQVLNKYELFDNQNNCLKKYNAQTLDEEISVEDREKLYSSYDYLSSKSRFLMPEWTKDDDEIRGFANLFNIYPLTSERELDYQYYNATDEGPIDVSRFSKMQEFYIDKSSWGLKDSDYDEYAVELPKIMLEIGDESFDLNDFIFNHHKERVQNSDYLWYKIDEKREICIKNYSFWWNSEKSLFKSYTISGYLFYKDF